MKIMMIGMMRIFTMMTAILRHFPENQNSYESAKQYSKRPLEAISLRQPKNLQKTEQKNYLM